MDEENQIIVHDLEQVEAYSATLSKHMLLNLSRMKNSMFKLFLTHPFLLCFLASASVSLLVVFCLEQQSSASCLDERFGV